MFHASLEQNSASVPAAPTQSNSRFGALQRMWPLALATALGVVILLAVGFAPGVAHEAAHDVRHGMAFPCH